MSSSSLSEILFQRIDNYVDSLAPQIQPRIASELELFQQKTIDSLETQVIDAFRSLFDKQTSSPFDRGLNNAAPDAYGGQSLPFADEIAKLTQSFGKLSDGASDDLRDIFDLTENRGATAQTRSQDSGFSGGARSFLSSALNAVQDQLENENGGSDRQGLELGGLLGVISNTVKDASRNPEETARLISPEIKDRVSEKLRSQHATIAEQFTRIALDHIKRWLRGNTSTRDLGDGARGEIEDHVKDLVKGIGGLFGRKSSSEETSQGLEDSECDRQSGDGGGGFSKLISDKMSTGLARVHREVRVEFRKVLGEIEKQLFELLPDQFQGPLEKILGGNPFDSRLDQGAGDQADRSFGDDIKAKLVGKIRDLVRKVQETLRESVLGVVNGGHRKLEHESWVFVQNIVEQKVQIYMPDVKIIVPDDIGDEGVSVGAPIANTIIGGGTQPIPLPQSSHNEMKRPSGQYSGQDQLQYGYDVPSQYQDNQNYQNESYQQQGPQLYQQQPQYNQQEERPPPQNYYEQHRNTGEQSGGAYQQQGNYQHNQPGGGYEQQDYRPRY